MDCPSQAIDLGAEVDFKKWTEQRMSEFQCAQRIYIIYSGQDALKISCGTVFEFFL